MWQRPPLLVLVSCVVTLLLSLLCESFINSSLPLPVFQPAQTNRVHLWRYCPGKCVTSAHGQWAEGLGLLGTPRSRLLLSEWEHELPCSLFLSLPSVSTRPPRLVAFFSDTLSSRSVLQWVRTRDPHSGAPASVLQDHTVLTGCGSGP